MTDSLHPFRRWLMPVALGLIVVSSQGCRSGGGGDSNPEFEESEVEQVEQVEVPGEAGQAPEAPSEPVTGSLNVKSPVARTSPAKPETA